MRRDIHNRRHKEGEPFNKYLTDIQTKMRRAGGYSRTEQIHQAYENMHPDYKCYIRPTGIESIQDLTDQAAEYEQILLEKKELRPRTEEAHRFTLASATYNRDDCCWRCKQRGHTRRECRRTPQKFCSQCGRDGVLTRDCHPRPGNGNRAELKPHETRPLPLSPINPGHTSQ